MKPSKPKRPAAARRQRRKAKPFVPKRYGVITTDREGGLPIPREMARDMDIHIGDDYAVWKEGDGWTFVFPKSAKPGVRIPKHAEWRKVEPALPEEPARTSGAELARRLARTKPQRKAAKAVAAAIKAMDKADCKSRKQMADETLSSPRRRAEMFDIL